MKLTLSAGNTIRLAFESCWQAWSENGERSLEEAAASLSMNSTCKIAKQVYDQPVWSVLTERIFYTCQNVILLKQQDAFHFIQKSRWLWVWVRMRPFIPSSQVNKANFLFMPVYLERFLYTVVLKMIVPSLCLLTKFTDGSIFSEFSTKVDLNTVCLTLFNPVRRTLQKSAHWKIWCCLKHRRCIRAIAATNVLQRELKVPGLAWCLLWLMSDCQKIIHKVKRRDHCLAQARKMKQKDSKDTEWIQSEI